MHASILLLLVWPLWWVVTALPAFVVAKRRGVVHPGEAFIPLIGPAIVILHSINRSGWLSVLGLIPLVATVFLIWLACVVPGEHGRTRWWIPAFLVPGVNFVAFYAYAFTLPHAAGASRPALAAR